MSLVAPGRVRNGFAVAETIRVDADARSIITDNGYRSPSHGDYGDSFDILGAITEEGEVERVPGMRGADVYYSRRRQSRE